MAKTSKIDVIKVAVLADLQINTNDKQIFADQLSKILDYVELLDKADTSKVEPTYNTSGQKNSQREDKVEESLSQEDALANAPKSKDGFFITKGVFSDG